MDLEKYKSAIEEYVDSYKKTWTKLQQQGIITKDILNYKLENLKKEIEHFLEFNESYGQLLLDVNHIKIKELELYSLTEIAKQKNLTNPSYEIQSWLRDRKTLEILMLWEKEHNQYFNYEKVTTLIEKTKEPSFTLTAKIWISETKSVGIISKQVKGGGTFAYHEIAIDFITWLFPHKRYELLKMIIFKAINPNK